MFRCSNLVSSLSKSLKKLPVKKKVGWLASKTDLKTWLVIRTVIGNAGVAFSKRRKASEQDNFMWYNVSRRVFFSIDPRVRGANSFQSRFFQTTCLNLSEAESVPQVQQGKRKLLKLKNGDALVFQKKKVYFSEEYKEKINQNLHNILKAEQYEEAIDLIKDDVVLNHISFKYLRQLASHFRTNRQPEEAAQLYLRFYEVRTLRNLPRFDQIMWFEAALEWDPQFALKLIQTFKVFRNAHIYEKFYGYLVRCEIPHRMQYLISALNHIAMSSRTSLTGDHLQATCDFVANHGKPKEILFLFNILYTRGFVLSEHIYTQILQAALVVRDHHAAVDILEKMRQDLNFVDSVHVALVVATFGRKGLYKEALEFLEKYQQKTSLQFEEDGAIQTALAFACAQAGDVEKSMQIIQTSLEKNLRLDANLFGNLLYAIGYQRNEEKVRYLLQVGSLHASNEHLYAFYEWALRGISRSGDFQLYQRILEDMLQRGLKKTNELALLQVRVACGALRSQDADAYEFAKNPMQLVQQVEAEGLEVTLKLLEALIVCCCWTRDASSPTLLLEEIKKRFGNYSSVGLLHYGRVCKQLNLTPDAKYVEALKEIKTEEEE
eukprot:jgi/Galph1/353/GphlegSOOS_G5120.1